MKEIYILVRKFPDYPDDGNEYMIEKGYFTDQAKAQEIANAETSKTRDWREDKEIWFVVTIRPEIS